jgi:hypothetical protein
VAPPPRPRLCCVALPTTSSSTAPPAAARAGATSAPTSTSRGASFRPPERARVRDADDVAGQLEGRALRRARPLKSFRCYPGPVLVSRFGIPIRRSSSALRASSSRRALRVGFAVRSFPPSSTTPKRGTSMSEAPTLRNAPMSSVCW